jgi:hypothetical protein
MFALLAVASCSASTVEKTTGSATGSSSGEHLIPTAKDLWRADGSKGSITAYTKALSVLTAHCGLGSVSFLVDTGASASGIKRLKLMQMIEPTIEPKKKADCTKALIEAESGTLPNPTPFKTSTTPKPKQSVAPPTQAAPTTPAGCQPLTNGGNCYEPGEYCRNSDHGATGVAGDGERIECEDNNGWRWEPV